MKNIALLAFLLLPFLLKASDENIPIGARSAAMANSSVTFSDVWSVYHNQAGLAFLERNNAAFYFENTFDSKALAVKGLAVALPTKNGTFGLSASYFGYSLFNRSKIGLAYAMPFGERFSVGVQVDYFRTYIGGDYGSLNNIAGEIGFLAEPIENLVIGGHYFNVSGQMFQGNAIEPLTSILRLGASYTIADKVLISVEAEKDAEYDMVYKTGLEYRPMKHVFIRGGISSNPSKHSFGVGYAMGNFIGNLSFSKHQVLGYTTHISIDYAF